MNDEISLTSLAISEIIYCTNLNEGSIVIPSVVQNIKYLFHIFSRILKLYEKAPNQLQEKVFMAASSLTQWPVSKQ